MSANTFRADLFAGHVAMVSGGTGGIGAAIGGALSTLGAEVTVCGATLAEAEMARSRDGFTGTAIALDVRDGDGVEACMGRFSRLDILINCAGVIRRGAEHDPKVFAVVIDKGFLPEPRAKVCKYEYSNVRYAIRTLIGPHIDGDLAEKVMAIRLFTPPDAREPDDWAP